MVEVHAEIRKARPRPPPCRNFPVCITVLRNATAFQAVLSKYAHRICSCAHMGSNPALFLQPFGRLHCGGNRRIGPLVLALRACGDLPAIPARAGSIPASSRTLAGRVSLPSGSRKPEQSAGQGTALCPATGRDSQLAYHLNTTCRPLPRLAQFVGGLSTAGLIICRAAQPGNGLRTFTADRLPAALRGQLPAAGRSRCSGCLPPARQTGCPLPEWHSHRPGPGIHPWSDTTRAGGPRSHER